MDRPPVFIRRANVGDSASLSRIQVSSWQSAYAGIAPDAYLAQFSDDHQERDWREVLLSAEAPAVFVAVTASGAQVGFIWAGPENSGATPGQAEVFSFHVLPEWKGQGIGRRLFAQVTAELCRQGFGSLLLWVLADNPSRHFYDHLGGQLAGERIIELGGTALREVAYLWRDIGHNPHRKTS